MTEEQILELAKTCEFDYHKKWRHKGGKSDNQIHWECWEEQLLKFARAIRAQSFREWYGLSIGAGDEYNRGYIDGVESVRNGVLGD